MKKNYVQLIIAILFATNVMAQNVPNYVPSNGLVGWWPFNGNANDESGNGNHALLSNTGYPFPLAMDRNNIANSAYTFSSPHVLNGVYLYISNPASVANFGTNSYTISVWFRTAANFGVSTNLPMLYFGANGSINTSWYLGAYVNSMLTGVTSGTYNYVVASSNTVADTSWHNAVWLRDVAMNEYRIYLDGVKLSTNNYGAFIENIIGSGNSQIYVGANPYGNPFYGDIDDIGIWHRVLSDKEILALYSGLTNAELLSNNSGFKYTVSDDKLNLFNIEIPCSYSIYSSDGCLIKNGLLEQGNNTINLNHLVSGLYLMKCMNTTIKFIK